MKTPFPSSMTMICASLLVLLAAPVVAQSVDRLEGRNVSVAQTSYKGRSAIQLIASPDAPNATSYALVKDALFRDGSIEVDLAGQPAAGAGSGARGFIGIAFRLQTDGRYESIYLRPTNGRADDQVRRNHSTQYSAHPDFVCGTEHLLVLTREDQAVRKGGAGARALSAPVGGYCVPLSSCQDNRARFQGTGNDVLVTILRR